METDPTAPSGLETIGQSILVIRDQRVILDADLARLYQVPTKALNQAVRRNAARFPVDFVFRLTQAEMRTLHRSHSVTGSQKHRDPRVTPNAFTEHGALMAASMLNSERAIQVSVYIIRAFVHLRGLLASNDALALQLDELERKYKHHDDAIAAILSAIRDLMSRPVGKTRGIGFTADIES